MALCRPFRLVGTIRGLDQHFERLLAVATPHRDIAVSDVGKRGLPTVRVRAAKQSPALRIIRFHFANLRTFAWSSLRSSLATCYRTLGVAEYGSCIARPFSHELARTVFVRARASECESYLGRTFREGEDAGLTATLGGVLLKQSRMVDLQGLFVVGDVFRRYGEPELSMPITLDAFTIQSDDLSKILLQPVDGAVGILVEVAVMNPTRRVITELHRQLPQTREGFEPNPRFFTIYADQVSPVPTLAVEVERMPGPIGPGLGTFRLGGSCRFGPCPFTGPHVGAGIVVLSARLLHRFSDLVLDRLRFIIKGFLDVIIRTHLEGTRWVLVALPMSRHDDDWKLVPGEIGSDSLQDVEAHLDLRELI